MASASLRNARRMALTARSAPGPACLLVCRRGVPFSSILPALWKRLACRWPAESDILVSADLTFNPFDVRKYIHRFLPDHEAIRGHRWLAPFVSTLLHPRLWHLNRHSAAGAVAIGLFCGLIPGPLQMLGAAIGCLVFRVNLPLALVTTLYTNPLTIIPLYVVAFGIGQFVLGNGYSDFVAPPDFSFQDFGGWIQSLSAWMYGLGKPLVVGLILLALSLAVIGYLVVKGVWHWYLVRAWKRKRRKKTGENGR